MRASDKPRRLKKAVAEGEQAACEEITLAAELATMEARTTSDDYAPHARVRLGERHTQSRSIMTAPPMLVCAAALEQLASFDSAYQRQLLPAIEGVEEAWTQAELAAAQLERREAEVAEKTWARPV